MHNFNFLQNGSLQTIIFKSDLFKISFLLLELTWIKYFSLKRKKKHCNCSFEIRLMKHLSIWKKNLYLQALYFRNLFEIIQEKEISYKSIIDSKIHIFSDFIICCWILSKINHWNYSLYICIIFIINEKKIVAEI